MGRKKINFLMLILGGLGGVIGFFIGEFLLARYIYTIPSVVLMGLYFGFIALFVGMGCLIAEIMQTSINSNIWRTKYVGTSWRFLLPCTFGILFVGGMFFQLLYGLQYSGMKKIDDVVMLVDISGSMKKTDPKNKRFDAVYDLAGNMDQGKKASIIVFNDEIETALNMDYVSDGFRDELKQKLEKYKEPDGGTNIEGALNEAANELNGSQGGAMVILLSDGGDTYNLKSNFNEVLLPFKKGKIPIYTVAMDGSDTKMLKSISRKTKGDYVSIDNAENISYAFNKIYKNRDLRMLVTERGGYASSSIFYSCLRVLFIMAIGILMGFGVGLVFDNRYIAKGLAIGGAISGIIAGFILEIGFLAFPWLDSLNRLAAVIVLSTIFTLFTFIVPKDEAKTFYRGSMDNQIPLTKVGARAHKSSF